MDQVSPTSIRPKTFVGDGAPIVWWVLGVWFVANLAACLAFYIWVLPLGWGSISYMIFGAPVVIAQFGLAAVWMWLGDDTRLARYVDLPIGMVLLGLAFSHAIGGGIELGWPLLQLVVVICLPLVFIRRLGARITREPSVKSMSAWWRFGIGDLLVATTCLAVLMGLLTIGNQTSEDTQMIFSLAIPAWMVTLLGFRGRVLLGVLLLLCLPWLAFIGLVVVGEANGWSPLPQWLNFELRLLLVLNGMQMLPLLIATGVLRWAGFRLRAVAPPRRPAA